MKTQISESTAPVLTSEDLLAHWQGHRALTRRVIEVFPEDKLFTYSLGGMRTFSQLIEEFFSMAIPTLEGAVTGEWKTFEQKDKKTRQSKQEILEQWDADTETINALWKKLTPERFQMTEKAFGLYEGKIQWILFYTIDNEIHHRAQAYVYLRSLGIEPPYFWER